MTTLDPRGLEAAAEAIASQHWRTVMDDARAAVTAYLAVTQPIVEDVQALKDMPVGVVVRSAAGTIACRVDESNGIVVRSAAGTIGWTSLMLPARVIWRPEP